MAELPAPDIVNLIRYGNEQRKRFSANLGQAVATGDTEAVHDLRVASRRLQDALELMGAWLGRKRVARVQRSLRRVRKAFRKVRDLDVLRLSLSEPAGLGMADANAREEMEAVLTRRRERAAAEAKRVGQRTKVARRVKSIEALSEAFSRSGGREPARLEEQLRAMLRRRAAALLRSDPQTQTTNLHEVRMHVKHLRYCAQLLEECRCLNAGDLMAALAQTQTLLGHCCDQIVAARTLSRLAGRWSVVSTQTALSAKLLEYATVRAQAAVEDRRKVLEQWPAFTELVKVSVPGLVECGTTDEEAGSGIDAPAPAEGGD